MNGTATFGTGIMGYPYYKRTMKEWCKNKPDEILLARRDNLIKGLEPDQLPSMGRDKIYKRRKARLDAIEDELLSRECKSA